MNNVLIITDINNNMQAGGVKVYTKKLIKLLIKDGNAITLLIEGSDHGFFDDVISNKIVIKSRMKIFNNNVFGCFYDKYLQCKYKLNSYDILIINTGSVSKFWGVSNKNTIHILHSVFKGRLKFRNVLLFLLDKVKKKKVYTVSNYARNVLITSGLSNCNVIHNGVDINSNSYTNKKNGIIKIISVGQLVDYKGIHEWIYVASKISALNNNVIFEWYGDGPKFDFIKSKINNKNIRLKGYKENIEDIITDYDIFYHPSKNENHCLSILEAMSAKLPIVACNVGGNSESVFNEVNGYIISSNNTEQHIDKLLLLIQNKNLREEFGKKSFEIYSEKFTNKIWENKIREALKNAIYD